MGITIPITPPVLNDSDSFSVFIDVFQFGGCVNNIGSGFGGVTGAEINSYYAAGGDCVADNHIIPGSSGTSQRITQINGPL